MSKLLLLNKKKIVFFTSVMGVGGVARVISLWSNYFSKNKISTEIVSFNKKDIFYSINQKIKHLQIHFKESYFFYDKVKNLITIYKLLKKKNHEILIFNKGFYVFYLFILKKLNLINKNLLLIYFVHGGTASFKYRYSNLFNIIAFSTFDYIICLFNNYKKKKIYNISIKKKILNKIFNFNWNKNKNKIKIINNPLTFKSKKKSQCKNKIVLSVGRLDKNKNHNFLIDAWKEIIKNNDDWKLYIIGDGKEKEMLNEKIQLFNLNKSVKVINEIKNIKRYYLNSSIFVSTSLDEGLALSILEAMECGLPIVSSPTYGAKYLIRNNINGFIYKKFNNPNNFVKKINILMNNKILRSKFSLASIRLAQFYNIKNLSSQWKSIIKN